MRIFWKKAVKSSGTGFGGAPIHFTVK